MVCEIVACGCSTASRLRCGCCLLTGGAKTTPPVTARFVCHLGGGGIGSQRNKDTVGGARAAVGPILLCLERFAWNAPGALLGAARCDTALLAPCCERSAHPRRGAYCAEPTCKLANALAAAAPVPPRSGCSLVAACCPRPSFPPASHCLYSPPRTPVAAAAAA